MKSPLPRTCLTTALLILAATPLLASQPEPAWTHWAANPAHTGTATAAPASLDTIAWTAPLESAPGELDEYIGRAGAVVNRDRVFVTTRRYEDDGTGLWNHTTNTVIAYDAHTGEKKWTALVDADSYEYDSWATPAIDTNNNTLLVASHFSIFAIDIQEGEILWDTELPKVLVNASPTVTTTLSVNDTPANRVFITDYTGFSTSGGGVYAINVSPYHEDNNPYEPGDIVWQDRSLPGTSGNTVAYENGFVYVGSTHGGVVRCYEAIDGGITGSTNAEPEWEAETGISALAQYAGFYGGLSVRNGYVYVAAYNFYGTGNTSRLYKIAASDGQVIWEQPCERTDAIPLVTDTGLILLSAGIEGFGSAVKIQAFQDNGTTATQLWDTYDDTNGSLIVGGWTHQPFIANNRLYCGTPDETQFFAPYTDLFILDLSATPSDANFILDHRSGSGGSPATTGRYLYSLGNTGLVAFRGCGEGDMDNDGDVDPDDYALWSPCLAGHAQSPASGQCEAATFECADLDHDNDVDLKDFSIFQENYGTDTDS